LIVADIDLCSLHSRSFAVVRRHAFLTRLLNTRCLRVAHAVDAAGGEMTP
jgi:hypothetical protein